MATRTGPSRTGRSPRTSWLSRSGGQAFEPGQDFRLQSNPVGVPAVVGRHVYARDLSAAPRADVGDEGVGAGRQPIVGGQHQERLASEARRDGGEAEIWTQGQ